MVRQLLFKYQKLSFLIAGISGSLAGIILLLGALQLYLDFDRLINGDSDLNAPQYFVINKDVSVLNTLFGGQKGFDEAEMNELRSIRGVTGVAPLTASHFKTNVSIAGGAGFADMGMYLDFFFEAVPDEYVDVKTDEWHWKDGDSLIPIIVPKDYINLYNFGFGPTQGMPPIPENMIAMLPVDVTITANGKRYHYPGKVVGLSERLNTILAPKSFVDYANKAYAGIEPGTQTSNRIIIRCEGPATPELIEYFGDNGYETSNESLQNSMLNSALNLVMSFCVVIGLIIIGLALFVFILYSQLIISKSSYQIQTLTFIGYSPKKLISTYMRHYIILFSGLVTAGVAGVIIVKLVASHVAKTKGFVLRGGIDWPVFLLAVMLLALFLCFNYLSIRKNVLKLAKNR